MANNNYQTSSKGCSLLLTRTIVLKHKVNIFVTTPRKIDQYPFCPADEVILERLRREYGAKPSADQ